MEHWMIVDKEVDHPGVGTECIFESVIAFDVFDEQCVIGGLCVLDKGFVRTGAVFDDFVK